MLERNLEKEEGRSRPSADERFEYQNEKLDRMIAQKVKIKQILTEEQFQKWERFHQHHRNEYEEQHLNERSAIDENEEQELNDRVFIIKTSTLG